MSPFVLAIPAALQGAAMLWDEAVFHRRRGLPRWERVGHPLDTLSLLVCLLWALREPFETRSLYAYAALAVFSCLLVTKDELVHAERCSPGEHWLHSLLFTLHPLVLAGAAGLWWQASGGSSAASALLGAQVAIICAFLAWQVGYWNFMARKVPDAAGS